MTHDPIRIAHLADTHLGFTALTRQCPETGRNQRSIDIERAFVTTIDQIIAAGDIDLVIHAGDVFHHSRPPMHTLIFLVRQLRRLEHVGIPTIVIGGNHDTPRLRTAGSVLDLCGIACNTVNFAGGYDWERFPLTIRGQRVVVTAVPHGAFTNEQPPDAIVGGDDAINILVAHGSYNLALTNERRGGADEIEDALLDSRYDYIALGHWHQFDRKGANVYYSGSTERIGLSDVAATPGYALVTVGGEAGLDVKQVTLPVREHLQLPMVHADGLSAEAIVDLVARQIERQPARGDAIVLCGVRDTALGVDREVLRMLRNHDAVKSCWAFIPDVRSLRAAAGHAEESSPIGQLLDEFNDFVASRVTTGTYEPAFAAAFRETGRTLLEEALRGSDESRVVVAPPVEQSQAAAAMSAGSAA